MAEQLSNKAKTTLNGAINSSVTSLVVTSATGFPTSGDFRILIKAEGANTDEILTVTAVSGTTFTVTRASEAIAGAQTASSHASGAEVIHVLTAGALRTLIPASSGVSARLALDYSYAGSDISGASVSAATWTDVISNQTFEVLDSTSLIQISVPAMIQAKDSSGGDDFISGRVVIDSGGTPINRVVSGFLTSDDLYHNMQSGNDPFVLTGLSAGTHTIKFQIYISGGGDYYLRPSAAGGLEFLRIQILELGSRTTASTGFIGAKARWVSGNLSATGSYVPVQLASEDYDTDGFHDNSTNNSRMTIPAGLGGKYLVIGNFYGANDQHYTATRKNGANDVNYGVSGDDGISTSIQVFDLVPGDYIELVVNANNSGINAALLSITKIDSGKVGSGIGAKAYHNTTESINNAVFSFNSEEFDTDGFHDNSTNNSRMTIPAGLGGKYVIEGNWYTGTSGEQSYWLLVNGSPVRGTYNASAFGGHISAILNLNAGDYVEMKAGGNATFGHASVVEAMNSLSIMRLDSTAGAGINVTQTGSSSSTNAITSFVFPADTVTYSGTTATIRQVPIGFIGASVYASANQSCNNSVILFDSENYDTDSFHSTSSNTSRFTVPAGLGGKYLVTGTAHDNSGSNWDVVIYKNSSAVGNGATGPYGASTSAILDLVAGDYVELYAYTGGASRTIVGGSGNALFSLAKLDAGRVGNGIGATAIRTADQTGVVTSTDTKVAWNGTDLFDTDGFHDPSTNNTRMTIPTGLGGKYVVTATVVWDADTSGIRQVGFWKNGSYAGQFDRRSAAGGYASHTISQIFDLVATDYIEVNVFQDSGSNRTLAATIIGGMTFSILRIDSQGPSGFTVEEIDGSPSANNINKIQFPADSMTVSGQTAIVRQVPYGFIGCRVKTSGSVSGTGSTVSIAFDAEDFDTDNFHDNSTNNSRITVPAGLGGKYLIGWGAKANANEADTETYLEPRINGTTVINDVSGLLGSPYTSKGQTGTTVYQLNGGDYIELRYLANSGQDLSSVDFWVVKLDAGRVGSGVGARVWNNGTQSIPNNTWTAQTFDSEDFDTDGFHSTSANTDRFTIPTGLSGKYLVSANIQHNAGAGFSYLRFTKNGTAITGSRSSENTASAMVTGSVVVDLVAGDIIRVEAIQNGGSTSTTGASSADYSNSFSIMRIDSKAGDGPYASGTGDVASFFTSNSGTATLVTGAQVTLTTGARRCLVSFSGSGIAGHGTSGGFAEIHLYMDNAQVGSNFRVIIQGNQYFNPAFTYLTDVLSAGSHTFEVRIRANGGGTHAIDAGSRLGVNEIPN